VVYGGSVSKILAPGLRLGWLVVPTGLRGEVADTKTINDLSPPSVEQFALAELLEQHEIDRHLRRARRHYRQRREAAVATLNSQAPHWSIEGTQAGLHLVAHIGPVNEMQLVLDAREAGANLFGLSWQYAVPDRAPAGLVLGYGGQSAGEFEAGIRRVIEVEHHQRR
jgi:GntR family transcriptional regulator/MocR family aminotransferase